MDILFSHPNFPGQFRHLAAQFAGEPENTVYAVGDSAWMEEEPLPGVRALPYPTPQPVKEEVHRYNRPMEEAVRRAVAVADLLLAEKRRGFEPDVVVCHPGWGDAFFLRDIFPATPIIGLFEFFYQPRGADVGFDPEFPMTVDDIFRLRILNNVQLLALDTCDHHITPTAWQRSRFPDRYQQTMQIIHEGIDTATVRPDPEAVLSLPDGQVFRAGEEILTFATRSLEPYRGIHQFLRALPAILAARPQCRVIIAGKDEPSYGRSRSDGRSHRQFYLDELGERLDLGRVHFTGTLAYPDFLKLLQVSMVHVYLTYPFILSWSMLEAMAAGCLVIGSDTPPVREVLQSGENGILVPFFDPERLATTVCDALARPEAFQPLRVAARKYIVDRYDFATVSYPAYRRLIDSLMP